MPTIFERIETALEGNDVTARVDLQITNLGQVGATVQGLVEHPPEGIEDLLSSIRTLPVPDLRLGGDLPGTLGLLRDVVPTDLSSVTGGVTADIEGLAGTVTADLARTLTAGLAPILELSRVLDIDLSCLADDGAAPPPAGAARAAGEPPPAAPPPATARTAAAIDQAHGALDELPDAFTTEALLRLLANGLAIPSRGAMAPRAVPVLDDLRDGLATLLDWHARPPAEIAASLAATLDALRGFVAASVDAAFGTLAADAAAAASAIDAAPLDAVADGLVTRLGELRAAVESGSLAGTGPATQAIGELMDQLEAARPALTAGALDRLPVLAARLQALPGDLDDQVGHVASVLQPPGFLPLEFPGPDPLAAVDAELLAELGSAVSPVIAWLQDLAKKLDLSAIKGPIETAANAARSAVDGVEQGLGAVTSEVHHLFGEVETLLDALDTAALVAELEAALEQFSTTVSGQLTALFAPVRQVLETAIGALGDAVGAFDPETIVEALQGVAEQLAGVLESPEVAAAREQVEAALTAAEQQLGTLSFTPIADEVVAAIDQVTAALEALEPSLLSTPLQLALQGAVAILPGDLEPITDPLLDDLQELVDSGPAALVEQVRAPVAALQADVRRFEPAALVGDSLSAPFRDAVAQLEAFKPSRLLDPVNAELAKVKDRLRTQVSPGRLLEPLEGPFDELLAAFDALRPSDLVEPLEQAVQDVIAAVLDALPIDEILDPVGRVLEAVHGVTDVVTKGAALLEKLADVLERLGDGPAGVREFTDGVLAKLDGVDTAPLQPVLDDVAAAVSGTTAASLAARATQARAPLDAALTALGPGERLAAVVQAHRAVPRAALAALPASAEKAAVEAALERSDPLAAALAGPFEALAAFRRRAGEADAALTAELAGWDARYHADDGALTCLATLDATPAALSAWVRAAVEPQVVRPLRALLAPAGPLHAAIGPVLRQLKALGTDLEGKLAAFGTGPGSAGEIKAAVDGLLDRLRGLDLALLRDSLDELFAQVRGKLVAIGPASLRPLLDAAFDDMLGALDVGQVLPKAQVDALDADFATTVNALKALDPAALVVSVVQPQFEATVLPLIDAFDLTGVLDALIGALAGLRAELDAELARVNEAYKRMLDAVPEINPLSISLDVEFDVGGLL